MWSCSSRIHKTTGSRTFNTVQVLEGENIWIRSAEPNSLNVFKTLFQSFIHCIKNMRLNNEQVKRGICCHRDKEDGLQDKSAFNVSHTELRTRPKKTSQHAPAAVSRRPQAHKYLRAGRSMSPTLTRHGEDGDRDSDMEMNVGRVSQVSKNKYGSYYFNTLSTASEKNDEDDDEDLLFNLRLKEQHVTQTVTGNLHPTQMENVPSPSFWFWSIITH